MNLCGQYSFTVILVSASEVVRAQSTNTSLSRSVSNPANARIADALVTATSLGTNIRYETTTNTTGEYSLAALPLATYRIEVRKPASKS
jgi:hypothetical protein